MRISRIVFFIVLFFATTLNTVSAQISSSDVENKSLQLYQQKNWAELIPFVQQAIKEGNDYFYLRMRIGIAFYEQKNYPKAEEQFKKALSFNSGDATATEYLYYSYLFNGQYVEAKKMSIGFDQALKKKTGTEEPSNVSMVFVEGGTKISDSANYYNNTTKTKSNFFDPAVYVQAGLSHYVGEKGASLLHAVTYFSQISHTGTLSQFQYYLQASIPLEKGWSVSPSLHWVNLSNSTTTTGPILGGPGGPPPPFSQTVKTVNNYFVGSVAFQKRMDYVTVGLGTGFSNMNGVTQLNHYGSLSISPLGNTSFVFGATAYVHTTDSYSSINTAFSPFLYFEPIKRLSIKAAYFSNQNDNIIEDNGYLVNNSPDLTRSRWSLMLTGMLSKHVSIYGLYQSEQKQEYTQKFNYQYSVFVAGLKFFP